MVSVMDSLGKMGLPIFQQNLSNTSYTNSSSPFPASIMDSFLASAGQTSPLLQVVHFIYRLLGSQLGIDPTVILTILGFLWGFSKIVSQVYAQIQSLVDTYFMCAVYVSEQDRIYEHIMKFMSQQPSIKKSQYLTAQTPWRSAWEEEDEAEATLMWTDGGEGEGSPKYINFANQAAKSSPRYVPAMGTTGFWHNGNFFKIYRKKESFVTTGWQAMKDTEEIKISCYGRSINPIKQLLADAKTAYYQDIYQRTAIYRPRHKELRRDYNMWQQVARRPIRPMRTVVLDSKEKHEILADINEYLHPSTPRWYASRGIPLRRGYLFHGPPGTGKTSFSFAIAGIFGIDIYVVSLQDATITEEDIALLFTRLPRRCIVLLEDIDTAGLRRDNDDSKDNLVEELEAGQEEAEKKSEEESDGKAKQNTEGKAEEAQKQSTDEGATTSTQTTDTTQKPLVNGTTDEHADKSSKKDQDKTSKSKKKSKEESSDESDSSSDSDRSDDARAKKKKKSRAKKSKKDKENDKSKKGKDGKSVITLETISLSGLLNAIDGVASHEGRILIMTTNKPEELDEALVRPGRVDMQVGFTNATTQQAGELFHRMYEQAATSQKTTAGKNVTAGSDASSGSTGSGSNNGNSGDLLSPGELKSIADQFAALFPEKVFSPAEIQGFLLKRKRQPRKALEDAPGWIEGVVKQKASKSKVATVQ